MQEGSTEFSWQDWMAKGNNSNVNVCFHAKKGCKTPMSVAVSVMLDEHGQVFRIVVIARDMTEINNLVRSLELSRDDLQKAKNELETNIEALKNAEEEQERQRQQLQIRQAQTIHASRLTTIGEMAAGIAHEMNQPLTGISYTLSFLKKAHELKKLDDDTYCDSLKDIDDCIKRMSRIINHMRTFSRQDTPNTEVFDVHETIEGAFTLLGEQLRLHDIEIVKDYDSSLPTIDCIPSQLEQVWINHITNARDSLDEKSENIGNLHKTVTIATKYNEIDETVDIVFIDNGMGMTEEVKNKMFNPFYTTKDVGKGTGLGLSISHGIISNHKGKYAVDSREGEGTTVTITLPIRIP